MSILHHPDQGAAMDKFQQGIKVTDFGDLLLAYLEQLEVEYVFGIPGGAIEPLFNAMARSERQGGPRAIITRHEAGAAFMADGYARSTGKLGVCCATTGPGATNLVTGVASAYENNIPLLVITAQTELSSFGSGAFQESSCTGINTVALFQHCTRHSTLISHPAQFGRKLTSAIITAFSEPRGPVHLSIPSDVMREVCGADKIEFNLPKLLEKPSLFDSAAVKLLIDELNNCSNPLFLIGDEASEAIGLILTVALKIKARIVVTPHGKGLVSPYHPLFRGVIGFSGHKDAKALINDSTIDSIFIVGARLGEWANAGWNFKACSQKIIHIEENEINLTKTPMAALHVRGRLETVFESIAEEIIERGQAEHKLKNNIQTSNPSASTKRSFTLDDEGAYVSDETPIKPQRLMRELPNIFPAHTHYLADPGNSISWATHYLHPYDRRVAGRRDARGGLFRIALDFASMGWGIGSAVGVALARPGEPVVCLTGDGSMLMNGQEITVALQEQLPVIYIVLNDSALGMVKYGQRMTGAEQIGEELPQVDFAAFARAMGVPAYTIYSADDLLSLDGDAICNRAGPTLLDVMIDKDEAPPLGARIAVLRAE